MFSNFPSKKIFVKIAQLVLALWLLFLVVLPLSTLVGHSFSRGIPSFLEGLNAPYAVNALVLTLWTAALTASINAITGTATAWVLVRYKFPGRSLISALVDLPFAIPTLVTGLMIVFLFGPKSPIGTLLLDLGIPVVFAPIGILIALQFITLPFVVRAIEPVLMDINPAEEEAAATLGAGLFFTFRKVILPPIIPAIAGGTLQGFARALAEFGSLVVVSGNIPGKTLTAPVFIFGEVESGRIDVATSVCLVLLILALLLQPAVQALYKIAGTKNVN